MEAALSIVVASSLLLLLPLTSSAEASRYSRLHQFQLLNDFFEVAAKNPILRADLSKWAEGKPNNLNQQLTSIRQGTGFCIELESPDGEKLAPTGCVETGDIVATHRTIVTGTGFVRINAKLWPQ